MDYCKESLYEYLVLKLFKNSHQDQKITPEDGTMLLGLSSNVFINYNMMNYFWKMGNNIIAWSYAKKVIWSENFEDLDKHMQASVIHACSVICFYTGDENVIRFGAICSNIMPKISSDNRAVSMSNLKYYYKKFPSKKLHYIKDSIHPYIPDPVLEGRVEAEKMFLFNPSLIKYKDGYIANLRYGNYHVIFPGGTYVYHDINGNVRTRNTISFLDSEFNVVTQQFLSDTEKIKDSENVGRVKGYEDVRLIGIIKSSLNNGDVEGNDEKDVLCFTCTRLDIYPAPQIYYGEILLEDIVTLNYENPKHKLCKDIKPRYFTRVIYAKEQRCEKNHLFHIHDNKLYNIYSHAPCKTYQFIRELGILTNEKIDDKIKINDIASSESMQWDMRGGAPPIQLKNGNYLGTIHEVVMEPDGRIYHTRLVEYKKNVTDSVYFSPVAMSDALKVVGKRVEFSIGLTYDHQGDIVFSFGLDDSEALISVCDYEAVMEMLIPFDKYYNRLFDKI